MPANLQQTYDFLTALTENNDREWFQAHRAEYEAARAAFTDLVAGLMGRIREVDDLGTTTPTDCIFRMNRDVRFSADKSPYRTNFAAYIANGGRQSFAPGFYLHLSPDETFVGGGAYAADAVPGELKRIRTLIADDPVPLLDFLASDDFRMYFGAINGDRLKNVPRGFDADHPAADLLKYKQLYVEHHLTREQMLGDDLLEHLMTLWHAMRPFTLYLAMPT